MWQHYELFEYRVFRLIAVAAWNFVRAVLCGCGLILCTLQTYNLIGLECILICSMFMFNRIKSFLNYIDCKCMKYKKFEKITIG